MPLDIHVDKRLCYTAEGWAERTEVYVELYREILETRLLADLDGNELKLFLALALQATILTPGKFFQHLAELGLATAEDFGKVICYQSQQDLGQQCGLNRDTVACKLERLETRGLVTRRLARQADGRYTRPLFLIHADHILSPPHRAEKFRTGYNHAENSGMEKRRAESTGTVNSTEGVVVDVGSPFSSHQKQQQEQPPESRAEIFRMAEAAVFEAFAQGLDRPYKPTARDREHLIALLTEGYSVEILVAGVRRIIAEARRQGKEPRAFGYCVPALRALPPAPKLEPTTEISTPSVTQAELPEDLLELLDQLAWVGNLDPVRQACTEFPERVYGWARYCLDADNRCKIRNPGSLFRRAIEGETWPPDRYLPAAPSSESCPAAPAPETAEAGNRPEFSRPDEGQKLWRQTLSELELQMTRATFDTWLRSSRALGYNGDGRTLNIIVKNSYAVDWLDHRMRPAIERTLNRIAGEAVPIHFVAADQIDRQHPEEKR